MPMPEAKSPTRVAIVEDDPATQARLAASIRRERDLTLTAQYLTGTAALDDLARQVPDVLLVDLGLPDIPGLELIRGVARDHPDCEILVFSALGDEASVLAAIEAGARGYLLKGTLARDIALEIRDLRNGGSPLSPSIARHILRRMHGRAGAAARLGEGPRPSDEDDALTPRERDVLNAIARGYSYAEAGELFGVSAATVHTHLKNIYRKLAVHSKTEAVFEAQRRGLV
jgi:DNA-binding NarL/FixJ family response regulator